MSGPGGSDQIRPDQHRTWYRRLVDIVTVSEAKATLSRLLRRALNGESIAIGRRGQPEVVLRAYTPDDSARQLGYVAPAEYWMADDFDEPMPDIEADFDGRRGR